MKQMLKHLFLMGVGAFLYLLIEILYRGHTHWTMGLVGGFCFLFIGLINEYLSWDTPLWLQALYGGATVTCLEFMTGCILNLWLGLDIWDYSKIPFNLLGQICLVFSIAWVGLSLIAIVLDDWLRYRLFGEEKPHYKIV